MRKSCRKEGGRKESEEETPRPHSMEFSFLTMLMSINSETDETADSDQNKLSPFNVLTSDLLTGDMATRSRDN